MTASLKKITAGDGYTYLTEQTAAADVRRGRQSLAEYYQEKGEAPGRWYGRGLSGLEFGPEMSAVIDAHDPTLTGFFVKHGVDTAPDGAGWVNTARPGMTVTEDQMLALFGEGRHPEADLIEAAMVAKTGSPARALDASRLGRPYPLLSEERGTPYQRLVQASADQYRLGHGLSRRGAVPDEAMSAIRDQAARSTFHSEYGREPDQRELNGWVAKQARPRTMACAGYDISFSPMKSVSVLYALANRDTAARIHRLHQQAVSESLAWLEDTLLYTREGSGGIRQVKTAGMIAALFDHRTSRTGDPDLHTHAAISNKVQTLDGKWLAIDGREIYQGLVAISEQYNTRLMSLLSADLGVSWTARPTRDGKPPVWEIDGVDPALVRVFSKRRTDIETRQAQLEERFRDAHGRAPTPAESHSLAQQATIETRPPKKKPRTIEEERAGWLSEARAALGGFDPEDMVRAATGRAASRTDLDEIDADALAVRTLWAVSQRRSTFRDTHVIAEAHRTLRAAGITTAPPALVDRVSSAALAMAVPLSRPDLAPAPAALTVDGRSMYRRVHADLYTTTEVLDAETRILSTASMADGRRTRDIDVAVATAQARREGIRLNPSQANLVAAMATSGRRVQLGLAPAGTGKTTAMHVLAGAWQASGGSIVGLSHQATAAQELRSALGAGAEADTLASLTYPLSAGAPAANLPRWARRLDEKTLVIIDEAGMASTRDLDRVISFAVSRGASVRLIGDDRQLAAIGAGGILRDIDSTYGSVTLNELMRFRDPVEAAQTLAVRQGRHDALGWYLDQGRVTPVTASTGIHRLLHDWSGDVLAGRESLMLAARLDTVSQLNSLAQQWRRSGGAVQVDRLARLGDGSTIGAGDVIATRANDRRLRVSATDFVKNRDRWVVDRVDDDGSVQAHRLGGRDGWSRSVHLPAEYVVQHVELGYATTITGAQGQTVSVSRSLYDGTESRESLYVATTRGRDTNQMYVVTGSGDDPHSTVFDSSDQLRTATEVLESILDSTAVEQSATTTLGGHSDPFVTIAADAATYLDACFLAAKTTLGPDGMRAIGDLADELMSERGYSRGLTGEPSWESLANRIAYLTVTGNDPRRFLPDAIDQDYLDKRAEHHAPAEDYAAVLHWRLPAPEPGPLPWLPAIPEPFTPGLHSTDWKTWRDYLSAYSDTLTADAAQIRDTARSWTTRDCPSWARTLLTRDPELVTDLAVWRHATAVPDNDMRPAGPRALQTVEHTREWDSLTDRLASLIEAPWTAYIPAQVRADPLWPVVAASMTDAVARGRLTDDEMAAEILSQTDDQPSLPDDYPAAALWARIQHELPAEADAISEHRRTVVRPEWADHFRLLLPAQVQTRLYQMPDWPRFAALVDSIPVPDRDQMLATAVDITSAHVGIPVQGWLSALHGTLGDLVAADDDQRRHTGRDPSEPLPDPLETVVADADLAWLDRIRAHDTRPRPEAPSAEQTGGAVQAPPPTAGPSPRDQVLAAERARAEVLGLSHLYRDESPAPDLLTPPHDADQPRTSRERILTINRAAADWYADQYRGSGAADYLRGRLGTDLVDDPRWEIGRAPAGWTALIDHMTATGQATVDELVDAGLAKHPRARDGEPDQARAIDVFRDRVMFPIADRRGDIVAFQGRARPGTESDRNPKYVNTPTTPAYTKGDILFDANLITGRTTPVLTEGPMDAIAATLAGDGSTVGVAALGTGITPRHADILIGLAHGPVLVALDADDAGRRAAEKANQLLVSRGADTRAVPLSGKDPAEMLATDPARLATYLAHPDAMPYLSVPVLQAYADRVIASDDPETIGTVDDRDPRDAATPIIVETLAQLPADQASPVYNAVLDHIEDKDHLWAADLQRAAYRRLPALLDPTPGAATVEQRHAPSHSRDAAIEALGEELSI